MTHADRLLVGILADTETSSEEKRVRMRALVANQLDGTLKVPTKVCVHCGSRALVKSGSLSVAWKHRGFSGTAVAPVAICLDGCKKTTANKVGALDELTWCYGSQDLTIVDGPIFATKDLPLTFTARQRAQEEELLVMTAPA